MSFLGPFIVGLSGTTLSAEDILRIQSPHVGGLILFSRNFENKLQLIEYVKEIRASGGVGKPIFVDHEGGRVQRFRDGFTAIPSMLAIGEAALNDLNVGLLLAQQAGFVLAAEIRACGLDMSFTPVLDLDWGNSEIIGNRSFGRDGDFVGAIAQALISGLALAGVQACGKHFPGHGWVKADSHLDLPVDSRSLAEIEAQDLAPYRTNTSLNMAAIMPAHVVYEQVDAQPACFSKFWMQTMLRSKYGYDGCIISDDLDMVGAHGAGDIRARAAAALSAGCDAILACNQFDDIDTLINHPVAEVFENVESRGRRMARLLARGPEWSWSTLEANVDYQRALEALSDL